MAGEPPKNRGGRPAKLNAELVEKFVELIEQGAWLEVTCDYVGISVRTCYYWLQNGEELHQKIEEGTTLSKNLSPKERRFLQFFHAVRHADAKAKVLAAKTLHAAALTDPKYALEFLSRRARDQYSARGASAPGEGGGDQAVTINVLLQQVATEVRDNLKGQTLSALPETVDND